MGDATTDTPYARRQAKLRHSRAGEHGLLRLQGHYAGKLDADCGPKTRTAVAAAGFEVTGGKKVCPSGAVAIYLRMIRHGLTFGFVGQRSTRAGGTFAAWERVRGVAGGRGPSTH